MGPDPSLAETDPLLPMIDLGRMEYAAALQRQVEAHAAVLAEREDSSAPVGRILVVEHDPPVITVSNRPSAAQNLIASPERLAARGVTVAQTDRGGDITYHGPGQLVVYPILDLNRLRLPLHDYIRLLEAAIIDTVSAFGFHAGARPNATGVWIWPDGPPEGAATAAAALPRKVAAIGVRVRRWVTLHGLALNVTTNLDHFNLIVPCGLTGDLAAGGVTSLEREALQAGRQAPEFDRVRSELAAALRRRIERHAFD